MGAGMTDLLEDGPVVRSVWLSSQTGTLVLLGAGWWVCSEPLGGTD